MLAVFQHSEFDAGCVSALGNGYMLCLSTRKLMLSACQPAIFWGYAKTQQKSLARTATRKNFFPVAPQKQLFRVALRRNLAAPRGPETDTPPNGAT